MHARKAVIVLGAGASKGASVSGKRTPPLDSDFLNVAANFFSRKKSRGKNSASVKVWNAFRSHLKSAGLDFSEIKGWRLEQLSTFLEARASLRGMQLGQGQPRNYAKALDYLKIIVCHVLKAEGGTRACELHKSLFQSINPKAVISFNYDLIADQSLAALGMLDWKDELYRGARFAAVPTEDEKGLFYKGLYKVRGSKGTPLLKLHGSMHYGKLDRGTGFRLSGVHLPTKADGMFEYALVPAEPYLIPPVAAKIEIKQQELRDRWYAALDYLHEAPAWIIWGYSFPPTDTISQVLFRTALTRNRKSKPVIVINPDFSVAKRVLDVCRKVSVEYYPSMERFLLERGDLIIPNEPTD